MIEKSSGYASIQQKLLYSDAFPPTGLDGYLRRGYVPRDEARARRLSAVHSSPPTVAPSRARFIYFLFFVFCRRRYVTTALAYGPEPYGYVTVVTKVRAHRVDHHLPN